MMQPAAIAVVLCVVASLACRAEDTPASAENEVDAAPAEREAATAPPKSDAQPDAKQDSAQPSSPGLIGALEDAKVKTACADLQMLRSSVEMFTAVKGECPRDLATLEAERIIARLREDPWGHAYQLRCSELELRSPGPDGEPQTSDDVVLGPTGDECMPR
jgi:hypothetical protein